MMGETNVTTYARGNVTVDRDFARFGDKAYAINKINTVEVRKEPPNRTLAMLLIAAGAITFLVSIGGEDGPGSGWIWGVLMVGLGVLMYRGARATYRLFLMTSSSEVQAYSTQDLQEVTELRSAVEGAMIAK